MKNNKGIGLVGVLIIIGVVVIAGGVVYYAGTKNNSPQPPLDNTGGDPAILQNQNDIANNNSIIKIKTYTNSSSGYQLDYPLDWYVKNTDIATSYDYNSFVLQNTEDAVLPGSDFSLKTSGSYISVSVKNNMNYSSYEEYIKNSGLPPKAMAERMAINAPIQGTEADIIKLSMIKVDEYLQKKELVNKVRLILQVHDELVYEVEENLVKTVSKEIKNIMENVVSLEQTKGIICKADISMGDNWRDMKGI